MIFKLVIVLVLVILSSSALVNVIGVVVILIAIGVLATQQTPKESNFQIITVGPVWDTDSWTCTSDADFIVHGALRGIAESLFEINVSNVGTQSLFSLEPGQLESFSIGASAGSSITITRTGIVTGFITLQTAQSAEADCISI